jgi:hypothetical protein
MRRKTKGLRNTKGLRRGGPGRKKGVPNKASLEAKEFCRRLVQDPAYVEKFERAFRERRLSIPLEQMVWAYAYGRPMQAVELSARPSTLEDIVCGMTAGTPRGGSTTADARTTDDLVIRG